MLVLTLGPEPIQKDEEPQKGLVALAGGTGRDWRRQVGARTGKRGGPAGLTAQCLSPQTSVCVLSSEEGVEVFCSAVVEADAETKQWGHMIAGFQWSGLEAQMYAGARPGRSRSQEKATPVDSLTAHICLLRL